MIDRRGKLFVVTAPSGAGKTTLIRALLAADPNLRFSVSFTTRPPRAAEQEGRDYYFVDKSRFESMIANGDLLEHARVFDNYYGTGRRQVEEQLAAGRHVILDIDWQGARQVRSRLPESVLVFVLPPSLAELARRLNQRATDSEEAIQLRLSEALADMSHWHEFDYVIVNDRMDTAQSALRAILAGEGVAHRCSEPGLRRQVEALLAKPGV